MRLGKTFIPMVASAGAILALSAATVPKALSQTAPGIWEVSGMPGAKAPVRQCLGDVLALAQFEHRTESCSRHILRDDATMTTVEYNCPGGGFGRSEVSFVTPRSLRIETQGISDGLPFHYVIQARRVADCPSRQTAARH